MKIGVQGAIAFLLLFHSNVELSQSLFLTRIGYKPLAASLQGLTKLEARVLYMLKFFGAARANVEKFLKIASLKKKASERATALLNNL